MAAIKLVEISKRYDGAGPMAVDSVSEEIRDGEFFVLLGPSGCGKSTLLKLIAGLEEPTNGEIYLDDRLVNYVSPGTRNIAMVFQNYALYPHMSVEKNIHFPLRMRKVPRLEASRLVEEAARALELEALLDRSVSQLSGGQRQRVALARALVRQPRAMLMDEPLSNLDALLRIQTREELLKLHRRMPGTVVYVTHDQAEATTMGDRIGVMNEGRLIQVGPPAEIYAFPANLFVAGFVGIPPMSFMIGDVIDIDGEVTFHSDGLSLALPSRLTARVERLSPGRRMTLGVRAEAVSIMPSVPASDQPWVVDFIEAAGVDRFALLRAGANVARARLPLRSRLAEGEHVAVAFDPEEIHLFDEAGTNVLAAPGSKPVDLAAPQGSAQSTPALAGRERSVGGFDLGVD